MSGPKYNLHCSFRFHNDTDVALAAHADIPDPRFQSTQRLGC